MIAWSEGGRGWKNEMRKVNKSATESLRLNKDDAPLTDTDDWPAVVNSHYTSIFHDTPDAIQDFHTILQAVMVRARNEPNTMSNSMDLENLEA